MNNKARAKTVRKYMEMQELKPQQLAKKAGLSQASVYHILSGKRGGHIDTYVKLAKALDIPVSLLVD